jgi:hypothetical protein
MINSVLQGVSFIGFKAFYNLPSLYAALFQCVKDTNPTWDFSQGACQQCKSRAQVASQSLNSTFVLDVPHNYNATSHAVSSLLSPPTTIADAV